ncbi:MAG: 2'-5' RNA ligase family protein [Sphingomonadaceae bacterium]|uniref:2'-5' RNA ligase family protein n=1 Tax=Thermaurantiacus sp. TaxID=2820283 RepID=UPI00298EE37B|nr:2'-5' RNA ligase family protein [Thermaurantiacus sp.]MCS6986527.1 2'-5' RNA ligase family protein [Sphingomonadaceae bacterium]MDW8414212.1 2'-5' RNA ligase family protein [Thermaurantiacus sp.]
MARQASPGAVVLTLRLPARLQERLEALRRRYYPPARNRVPAHLTLFRQLPGPALDEVTDAIAQEAVRTPPFPFQLLPPRAWGGAIVLPVTSEDLMDLHARLAERMALLLGAADRGPYRPHVTLANHLDLDARPVVLGALSARWPRPEGAVAEGLTLWQLEPRGGWLLLVTRRFAR